MGYGSKSRTVSNSGRSRLHGTFRAAANIAKMAPRAFKLGVKMAAKKSNSYTKTKTKRRKTGRVRQDGTGTSQSFCYFGKKKPSKMGKMVKYVSSPQITEAVGFAVLDTGTPGKQYHGSFSPIGNSGDIANMFNSVASRVSDGVSTAPAVPTLGNFQKSFKMYITSLEHFVAFSNSSNGNVTLDIYDCLAKRDRNIVIYPDIDWQNGQRYDERGGLGGVTGYDIDIPYTSPFTSEIFKLYWDVKKITHVDLAQGRSHEHVHHHDVNRMIDTELYATAAMYKGLTSCIMVVVRGMPVETAINSGVATLADARVVSVARTKFKYRLASTTPTIFTDYNNLSLAPITDPTLLSEGLGSFVVPVVS